MWPIRRLQTFCQGDKTKAANPLGFPPKSPTTAMTCFDGFDLYPVTIWQQATLGLHHLHKCYHHYLRGGLCEEHQPSAHTAAKHPHMVQSQVTTLGGRPAEWQFHRCKL